MTQPYLTSCPQCGMQMTAHVGHSRSAPWFCGQCHLGFFVAELTQEARSRYRVRCHDWGYGQGARDITHAVSLERDIADIRGTSALPEHLGFLTHAELVMLQRRPLSAEFAELVAIALNDGVIT